MNRYSLDGPALRTLLRNAGTGLRNALAELPGERPHWLVVELSGSYPARNERRKLLDIPPDLSPKETSLETLTEQIQALARAPWLQGVVFRPQGLHVNLATAYALRRLVATLRQAGKQTLFYLTRLDLTRLFVASAAGQIVMPESAELAVTGLAIETTFMRDALARFGVAFEKLAIDEYKNAGDTLARQEMSEAQREQYGALLDSFQATLVAGIADGRGVSAQAVRSWIDEGVTSARRARELGMIDRVAYEDEFLSPTHKPYRAGAHFLRSPLEPLRGGRIAVISLLGVIVPGKSRRSPLPLPLVGGQQAGSETLVNAFRAAEMDARTQAIVFYVDSGGGSALASDLIWREVARIRTRKPVIAVMGGVAGSGGYYVLTHANRVIAAPGTLTGSIGVLSGKFVLQQFNAKYGFHPEALQRGRFALTDSPSHPYDETERALVRRSIEEVYDRFTARVAEGRGLTRERVHEIGRGRIWSGQDALELGLVDELGDLSTGIACARELAGLPERAPVWNVEAPAKLLLPSSEDPTMLARTLAPLLRERVLLLEANSLRVG